MAQIDVFTYDSILIWFTLVLTVTLTIFFYVFSPIIVATSKINNKIKTIDIICINTYITKNLQIKNLLKIIITNVQKKIK